MRIPIKFEIDAPRRKGYNEGCKLCMVYKEFVYSIKNCIPIHSVVILRLRSHAPFLDHYLSKLEPQYACIRNGGFGYREEVGKKIGRHIIGW